MHSRQYTVQSYGGAAMKVRLGQIRRSLGSQLDAGQPVRCRAGCAMFIHNGKML